MAEPKDPKAWKNWDETRALNDDELDPARAEQLAELVAERLKEGGGAAIVPSELGDAILDGVTHQVVPGPQDKARDRAAVAATLRRILIETARARALANEDRIEIACEGEADLPVFDVLELDDAIEVLDHKNALQSRLVALRVFGGLTIEQISLATTTAAPKVLKTWDAAMVWLKDYFAE